MFGQVLAEGFGDRELKRFRNSHTQGEGCWEWTKTKYSAGYGQFYAKGKVRLAHRVSYEIHKGELLKGFHVDHMCHNKKCVNPKHLRAVTHKQNMENRKGAQKNSSTGVRGVVSLPSGKYRACVRHKKIFYSGGVFETISEAEEAVIKLREKLFTNDKEWKDQ